MSAASQKLFAVILSLVSSAGLAILGAHAQSSATPALSVPKLAEEQFKNIQVLKGVPADQVFRAMQFITSSLGVECEYCHVREAHGLAFDKRRQETKIDGPQDDEDGVCP